MSAAVSSPSMSETSLKEVKRLTEKVWSRLENTPETQRIIIGISGIPGAGKSTLGRYMAKSLNDKYRQERGQDPNDFAVDIPMDGFHYSRMHLAGMADPATAIHRRGAAFTFDSEQFYNLIKKLRQPVSKRSPVIYAPSFDHAVKDPVADDIAIQPSSRIVFIEGNYISLNRDPWKSAALLMDERWFVTIDRDVARERLAERHVASGIVPDAEAAYQRIDSTDSLNADDILEFLLDVDEEIVGDT